MRKFAKATLPFMAAVALLVLGTATVSMAARPVQVPEIDPASGAAAFTLIAGSILIIRGRRKN